MPTRAALKSSSRPAAASGRVSLIVVPTGTVNVCLVDASGKALIDNRDLHAGERTRRYRGRRLRISFGNGQAQMLVNGRRVEVPDRLTGYYELRADAERGAARGAAPDLLDLVRAGIVITGTEVLSGIIATARPH